MTVSFMVKQVLVRIVSLIVALALICAVVWLGFSASSDTRYVLWFGLASALVAPVGLSLLTSAITPSNNGTLKRLEKVPEVQALIQEAREQEHRVAELRNDIKSLKNYMRHESRRVYLMERQSHLRQEARRLLTEIDHVDSDLRDFGEAVVADEINARLKGIQRRVSLVETENLSLQTHTDAITRVAIQAFSIVPFGGIVSILLSEYLARRSMRDYETFRKDNPDLEA